MPARQRDIESICGMVTGTPSDIALDSERILGKSIDGLPAYLKSHLLRPQFMAAYADSVEDASRTPPVWTVGAREFKDNCLQILREVNETGETVVVTRHKVPIAQICAPQIKASASLFGRCAGELRILGDITEPVFDLEEFDMEARPGRVLDPEGYEHNSSG